MFKQKQSTPLLRNRLRFRKSILLFMRIEESSFEGKLQEYHLLDFGTIYFFENIIVSEINEGTIFSIKLAEIILELGNKHYDPKKNVVYISNRVNSYSVKPTDWIKINNKFKNLVGIGVVNYTNFSRSIFAIEKMFSKRTFLGFNSLYEALEWAEVFVKENNEEVIIPIEKKAN